MCNISQTAIIANVVHYIKSITHVSESPDVTGSEDDVGEDAAFERIRHMLLNLIQQAQSAVSHKVEVSSCAISRRGIYIYTYKNINHCFFFH
jgi:hypothetical protein